MDKYILVGSAYFFAGMDGYETRMKDYVKIADEPRGFKVCRQATTAFGLFEWKRMTADEYVEYALSKGTPGEAGKFLIPEFCEEIGFTLTHLKKLKSLFDSLDSKHQYEKLIYNAYIKNKSFTLTDAQRKKAFEAYKAARPEETEE